MDQLWAPWRLSYVASDKPKDPGKGGSDCFLCRGQSESTDRENLIALRTTHSLVVLNRFPYNAGHLLVTPKEHKSRPDQLTTEEALDLHQTLCRCLSALDELMTPQGYNVGLNLGRAAGAGLPGHLHWHIVPRWEGDTNFMPVLGETRVIVQSLDALYQLLAEKWGA